MKLGVLVLTLLPIVAQTGCAGMLLQLTNPPITSDHLDKLSDKSKLKTVSGDRRLVRVSALNEAESKYSPLESPFMICAETQADAISARSAKSAISAALKESQSGSLTDEAAEALTLTYQRTELSDVVRQLSWQLCNARMNGDLDRTQYQGELDKLVTGALEALKVRPVADNRGDGTRKPDDTKKPDGTSDKPPPSAGGTSKKP